MLQKIEAKTGNSKYYFKYLYIFPFQIHINRFSSSRLQEHRLFSVHY